MLFEVSNRQADMNEDVSRRAKRLLKFSLSRFKGAVSRVKVMLCDINGPKGGVDKRCRITAKFRAAGLVVAQSSGVNYIEALNSCLEKLERAIRREIDRRRSDPIRKKRREVQNDNDQNELGAVTK